MAVSRTDKSTIPQGKDPLANVSYNQTRPPIDTLITNTMRETESEIVPEVGKRPNQKEKPTHSLEETKGKVTVLVSNDVLERLRNAAWWKRETLAAIAEEGIRLVVEKLERDHGGPYQPRRDELKSGRPQGSRSIKRKVK